MHLLPAIRREFEDLALLLAPAALIGGVVYFALMTISGGHA